MTNTSFNSKDVKRSREKCEREKEREEVLSLLCVSSYEGKYRDQMDDSQILKPEMTSDVP